MWKMSIQYTVLGFELTTFGTWVSSHNHLTRAPAQLSKSSYASNGDFEIRLWEKCPSFEFNQNFQTLAKKRRFQKTYKLGKFILAIKFKIRKIFQLFFHKILPILLFFPSSVNFPGFYGENILSGCSVINRLLPILICPYKWPQFVALLRAFDVKKNCTRWS